MVFQDETWHFDAPSTLIWHAHTIFSIVRSQLTRCEKLIFDWIEKSCTLRLYAKLFRFRYVTFSHFRLRTTVDIFCNFHWISVSTIKTIYIFGSKEAGICEKYTAKLMFLLCSVEPVDCGKSFWKKYGFLSIFSRWLVYYRYWDFFVFIISLGL